MKMISCKELEGLYKVGLAILFVLIMLFTPVFDFFMRYWVFLAVGLFFSAIYSWNDDERVVYHKQMCFYAVVFEYLVILISLYQIIFGDPTNWLGTGIDLTKLPKV